jgi:hypothetical protein
MNDVSFWEDWDIYSEPLENYFNNSKGAFFTMIEPLDEEQRIVVYRRAKEGLDGFKPGKWGIASMLVSRNTTKTELRRLRRTLRDVVQLRWEARVRKLELK